MFMNLGFRRSLSEKSQNDNFTTFIVVERQAWLIEL